MDDTRGIYLTPSTSLKVTDEVDAYISRLIKSTLAEEVQNNGSGTDSSLHIPEQSKIISQVHDLALNLKSFQADSNQLVKDQQTKLQLKSDATSLHSNSLSIFSQYTAVLVTTSQYFNTYPAADHTLILNTLILLQQTFDKMDFELLDKDLANDLELVGLTSMSADGTQDFSKIYTSRYEMLNAENEVIRASAEFTEAKKNVEKMQAHLQEYSTFSNEFKEVEHQYIDTQAILVDKDVILQEAIATRERSRIQGEQIQSYVAASIKNISTIEDPIIVVSLVAAIATQITNIINIQHHDDLQIVAFSETQQHSQFIDTNPLSNTLMAGVQGIVMANFNPGQGTSHQSVMDAANRYDFESGEEGHSSDNHVFESAKAWIDFMAEGIQQLMLTGQFDENSDISELFMGNDQCGTLVMQPHTPQSEQHDHTLIAGNMVDVYLLEEEGFNYDASKFFCNHAPGKLTYSLGENSPEWVSIDPVTGLIAGRPSEGDAGSFSIEVYIINGLNESAHTEFTLTVYANNEHGEEGGNNHILDVGDILDYAESIVDMAMQAQGNLMGGYPGLSLEDISSYGDGQYTVDHEDLAASYQASMM